MGDPVWQAFFTEFRHAAALVKSRMTHIMILILINADEPKHG